MSAGRSVYGVGLNDADYSVTLTEKTIMTDGARRNTIVWQCPFYGVWRRMMERAYSPAYKSKFPTYSDVYVCDEWLVFSRFKAWMTLQDWSGKQLDKDILYPGNREYSPEFCAFVDRKTNMLLCGENDKQNGLPPGVGIHKATGRFRARCRNPFDRKASYLGQFGTAEEAHQAWRERKHELACMYACYQTDQRVADALRTRYLK